MTCASVDQADQPRVTDLHGVEHDFDDVLFVELVVFGKPPIFPEEAVDETLKNLQEFQL